MELAERLDRLWAALIDRLLFLPIGIGAAILIPGLRDSSLRVPVAVVAVCLLFAVLGYQMWLLTTAGQTIGKRLMKLKIVRIKDLSNGGFVVNVLLRVVASWAITAVPVIGSLFGLANPLFIFRDDRRCLHDHIAGTCVIKA